MYRFYAFGLITTILILIGSNGYAQISQGGEPLAVFETKSAINDVVKTPAFAKWMISGKNLQSNSEELKRKPVQFAHPFDVNLNLNNSGTWYQAENGWNIWKLTIQSEGAKSLNLIFDYFKLPENARLFIFNNDQIMGAFTSYNNKSSQKFASAPISGDQITIQYETLKKPDDLPFNISNVNHDYLGILEKSDRRPLSEIAGECNIDINCDIAQEWEEVKDAVCRIIVHGKEVCSGALVNNTAEDQKPYVLSAAHCYDEKVYAETSVYVFSFESPFCVPLDGDPSNSISGAEMRAHFDSLDFALTELSLVPPPDFKPYYAGWDNSTTVPSSTASIHHPWGMIKKIAIDYDAPIVSDFGKDYKENTFYKINRWDAGVTEAGSSGGPLFSADNKKIIGTLTGGWADCDDPTRDYFERLALSWDLSPDSSKQLKYWLDPLKSNAESLDGKQFYEGEDLCGSFTNLMDSDDFDLISILDDGSFSGYWGGSNNAGITEFMERFSIPGAEQLAGVSLGIAKIDAFEKNNQSEITIKVYNGDAKPEETIYTQKVKIAELVENAMNFIGFSEAIFPNDTFFVGFEISGVQPADSFAVFQSLRFSYEQNNFWLKQNGEWFRFSDVNPSGKSLTNVFEILACNIDDFSTDTPLVDNPKDLLIYPNPTESTFVVEAGQVMPNSSISVYNLLGQQLKVKIDKINSRKAIIDMTGNIPGVYLVRFQRNDGFITRKVSYVPW